MNKHMQYLHTKANEATSSFHVSRTCELFCYFNEKKQAWMSITWIKEHKIYQLASADEVGTNIKDYMILDRDHALHEELNEFFRYVKKLKKVIGLCPSYPF